MPTGVPDISVVIPVHNGAEFIRAQLEAVGSSLASVPSAEVLVVDNRSDDGSANIAIEWARRTGAPLEVIDAHERAGEPYARNVGWRAARSDLIAYCDADDVVSPQWLRALFDGLQEHDYVTGPLDTYELNDPAIADLRGQALFRSLAHVHEVVPFAHGCNMGFRRSTLEDVGGFDESFLIACDIEIAVRLWRSGVELAWLEDAVVHYRLRSTPAQIFRQARAYGRSRHRITALVPEAARDASPDRRRLRRLAWLVRHIPETRKESGRARWAWVGGQVVGELEGAVWPTN